jgi:hypothetical protein
VFEQPLTHEYSMFASPLVSYVVAVTFPYLLGKVKVKLCSCVINWHAMKTFGGGEWSASRIDRVMPAERARKRLGVSHSRSARCGVEKYLLSRS